ncbi:hypothetical protein RF11_06978 [Thelohanellus kitauei]|uniref:Uncharacterized protein n=1 Tax=Thelohanellus kitauei TaxID=669202 RepID=A0A0C2JMP6_THEKT|nr:hypothetical protein RF11_06978 [Thelohanellus kitauei]
MDQGIIENFKSRYKKHMVRGIGVQLHVFDALHVERGDLEQVGKSTIKNCFAKTKLIKEEIITESQDAELIKIWEALPYDEKICENREIDLSDVLEAYERLTTGGSFTQDKIEEKML